MLFFIQGILNSLNLTICCWFNENLRKSKWNETIWGDALIHAFNLYYWYILKKHECDEKMLWIHRGKYFDLCSPLRLPAPVFPAYSYLCPADIVWLSEQSKRNNLLSPLSSCMCSSFAPSSLQFNSHRLPGATLFHQHGRSWQWFLPLQGSTLTKQLLALADMIAFLKSFLLR